MPRRRVSDLTGDTVAGQSRIPYDRTDPMQQVPAPQGGAPQGAAPSFEGAAGGGPPAGAPQDVGSMLGGLGGADQMGAGALGQLGNTDQLTGADLGAMGADTQGLDVGSADDIELAQLEQALQDPNTPPEMIQVIQQQLALAARRRLAGMGQPQAQGLQGLGM